MTKESKDSSDGYERLADMNTDGKNEYDQVSHMLREVVANYTDLSNVFRDFYNENLRKLPEQADRIGSELGNSLNGAKEVVDSMSDLSPAAFASGSHVSKMFANSSVFVLFAVFSSLIGHYLASPVFNLVFLKLGAVLIVSLLIPFVSRLIFFNSKHRLTEKSKRIMCATFIFEHSILIGFINQSNWFDTPSAFMTQIVASFAYPVMLSYTDDRSKLLGAVASGSMLFHVAHAVLTLNITFGFLLVAALYTLLAIAFIQYIITFRTRPEFDDIHVSMQYVFAVSLVKMFSLMALGEEK